MAMELSRFGDTTADGMTADGMAADGMAELKGFGAGAAVEGRLITCSS